MENLKYRQPNILQADSGGFPQNMGEGGVLSIRCPHCSHQGAFPEVTQGFVYEKWTADEKIANPFRSSQRRCPNPDCLGLVFTIQGRDEALIALPPELIDFDASDIPETLVTTLKEAISCHAVGAYRASAMMVRRLLEEMCEDNDAEGRTLHDRLLVLKGKITLPQELFEAMGELKALGNDAAHITAKNYDQIGEGEAADSIELAKEILKSRYQLKNLVARLQARKKAAPA